MKRNKTILILVLILMVVIGPLYAQLKSQLPTRPSIIESILPPQSSTGGFFNPNRFRMNQYYSLSFISMGKYSTSIGLYLNRMSYTLNDKTEIEGMIGFVHNPLSTFNPATGGLNFNNLIYGARINYRPFNNMTLNIGFQSWPHYNTGYYNTPSIVNER